MAIKKHIPNILSTIRLGMALALPFVFLNTTLLNTLIFYLVGDATDAVDGFLARKWKVQSKYGKFVDPLADKLLNGLTLLLSSIFVNPALFLLTGFEALIAGTTIARIKKKKDINVAIIGKVKTVALFFTTVMSLLAPMVPSLKIPAYSLIGVTAVLQAMTAAKYLSQYKEEKDLLKKTEEVIPPKPVEPIKEDDSVKKLEYAKERLTTLSSKQQECVLPTIQTDQVVNCEPIVSEIIEDKGIARTLKK